MLNILYNPRRLHGQGAFSMLEIAPAVCGRLFIDAQRAEDLVEDMRKRKILRSSDVAYNDIAWDGNSVALVKTKTPHPGYNLFIPFQDLNLTALEEAFVQKLAIGKIELVAAGVDPATERGSMSTIRLGEIFQSTAAAREHASQTGQQFRPVEADVVRRSAEPLARILGSEITARVVQAGAGVTVTFGQKV
jgi:hypothetical protein